VQFNGAVVPAGLRWLEDATLSLSSICGPDFYSGGDSKGWIQEFSKGGRARGAGNGSPPVESSGKPGNGSAEPRPPKAEAKCEISVHFLAFSCRKFRI